MVRSFVGTFTLALIVVVTAGSAAFAQATQSAAAPVVEDPNTTRLFFGPTGRSLKKGEVTGGVYELVLPFVQVGITDRLSVGGGTPLLFGDFDRPFWFTPKFKIVERGSTAASLGVMHFLNIDDQANIGVAYGVVTRGTAQSSVTAGAGYAYARWELDAPDDDNNAGAAVLMLGGDRRVAKGIKLVTENYAFKRGGFMSGGVRFFGEKLSADVGLMVPLGADTLIALPIVNIVRKF